MFKKKSLIRRIKWSNVLLIALIIATPKLNEIANASRAIPGYGGECLAWTIPLLYKAYKVAIFS